MDDPLRHTLRQMLAYGQWANALLLDGLARVGDPVLDARQAVVFGSIRLTAQHLMMMGEVWRAHLTGAAHGVVSRNPAEPMDMRQIDARLRAVDGWALEHVAGAALGEVVCFTFIDGGAGAMTRAQILLHLVNHATYHRGHIAAMLNAAGGSLPASDMPVFLA